MQTPLESALKQIITAGWANKSDGDVEAPTGFFALITISDNEMDELVEACELDDDQRYILEPGKYVTRENSDGNIDVKMWPNLAHLNRKADQYYNELAEEFVKWDADWKQRAIAADIAFMGEVFSPPRDED